MPEVKRGKDGRCLAQDEVCQVRLSRRIIKKASWFRNLSDQAQMMILTLLDKDYWFFIQMPYVELAEIDGQDVILPYTNGCLIAIVRKQNGKWHFVDRWWKLGQETPGELRAVYNMQMKAA